MRQRAIRQRQLFEDKEPLQCPQLQPQVRQEVTQLLVQWMQRLARAIGAEVGDEHDQR
jgi:hypothetical protein